MNITSHERRKKSTENDQLKRVVIENLKNAGLSLTDIKHVFATAKKIPFFTFKKIEVNLWRVK